MMYLLVSTMLLRSFSGMDTLVAETLSHITRLIKLLLPAYLASIVFSAGSLSALGFYQAATVTIALLQGVIMRGVLPLLQFYLAVLMLNQMTKEDLFSRFAQLLQTIVDWSLKTVIGVAVGLQTVQCLIAPGVDSFKNSAAHRIAKAIPGIGNLFDAASETVTGSAIVIRNAIGTGGMLLIAAICLLPLLKLLTCILIFRLLCAIIQPICEKRMLACVESISCAAALLLRILCGSMAVLLILLAMILSSLKGGCSIMREWLKLLLYSICIITLLLHLLPDGKFVKYVRFYAGLLFFLIALEPLLGLFLGNGELTKLLQLRFLKEEYRDLSGTVEGLGELKNTRIREAYKKRSIVRLPKSPHPVQEKRRVPGLHSRPTDIRRKVPRSVCPPQSLRNLFRQVQYFLILRQLPQKQMIQNFLLRQRRSARNYFRYMHCRQKRFSFLIQEAHPFELAKMEWWKKRADSDSAPCRSAASCDRTADTGNTKRHGDCCFCRDIRSAGIRGSGQRLDGISGAKTAGRAVTRLRSGAGRSDPYGKIRRSGTCGKGYGASGRENE